MKRTGIDDPGSTDAIIADLMRVTVKQIIRLRLQRLKQLPFKVAVREADSLVARREFAERVVHPQSEVPGTAIEGGNIIAIPEDDSSVQSGKKIKNPLVVEIAEVDEKVCAGVFECVNRPPGDGMTSMGVGENADAHDRRV